MCASMPIKNNSRLISEDPESGRIALTLSWMRGRRNRAPSWGEGEEWVLWVELDTGSCLLSDRREGD